MATQKPIKHIHNFKNLLKQKFDYLTVKKYAGRNKHGKSLWLCRCKCGGEVVVIGSQLTNKNTRSCGCFNYKNPEQKIYHHGKSGSPIYEIWCGIKKRCYNPRSLAFRYYGARGIVLCQGWQSPIRFLSDIGPRPSKRHSIERLDNEGNYSCGKCPECKRRKWLANCVWATPRVQSRNNRRNHIITFRGKSRLLTDWAKRIHIGYRTLYARLKRGWSVEDAITRPLGRWL